MKYLTIRARVEKGGERDGGALGSVWVSFGMAPRLNGGLSHAFFWRSGGGVTRLKRTNENVVPSS